MMDDRIYHSYKAEIAPTAAQKEKMRQNMGVCRFLYNEYLNMNIRLYQQYLKGELDDDEDHFISAIDFDKYVNRSLKCKDEFSWIGLCGSKARKKAVSNAQVAYINYFKNERRFPQFKSYGQAAVKLYYPRNNPGDWTIGRDFIKVPTFGRVRLKEYGYLPVNAAVMSGTVSYYGGRYFVSILVKQHVQSLQFLHSVQAKKQTDACLHMRFDARYFMRCEGVDCCNVEELDSVKKLKKALHREVQSLKRKLSRHSYSRHIEKQRLRIEKLRYRLSCIRQDFIHKLTVDIVRRFPSRIVLEQLSPLADGEAAAVSQLRTLFYVFTRALIHKARIHGIEVIEIPVAGRESTLRECTAR